MPQEAQLGWFGALDHFSFSCVFARSLQRGAGPRRGCWAGPGSFSAWELLWPLWLPGADAVALSTAALPPTSVSHGGCDEQLGVPSWFLLSEVCSPLCLCLQGVI